VEVSAASCFESSAVFPLCIITPLLHNAPLHTAIDLTYMAVLLSPQINGVAVIPFTSANAITSIDLMAIDRDSSFFNKYRDSWRITTAPRRTPQGPPQASGSSSMTADDDFAAAAAAADVAEGDVAAAAADVLADESNMSNMSSRLDEPVMN
jgi:hypothetical protein